MWGVTGSADPGHGAAGSCLEVLIERLSGHSPYPSAAQSFSTAFTYAFASNFFSEFSLW